MNRLEIRGVHKAFDGQPVLQGLDLSVPSGALAAVLGPSGAGKTTLLRVIAGFEPVDDGEVRIGGRTVSTRRTTVPPERRRIGIVPQEGALFPHLTVAQNVGFGLPARRPGERRARTERVTELLDLLGLGGLGTRMPRELSGGQQQRIAVARALAPDPAVILLDEPFSALDAGLRSAVRSDVRAALRATGATGLIVTHDQEEALSIADLVAVVRDGRVVQAGSPQEIYHGPGDLQVATFVGEAVVVPAVVTGGIAMTAVGRLNLLRGARGATGPGHVVIRPEQVRMVRAGRGTLARVVDAVFHGHDASVYLEVQEDGAPVVPLLCRTQGPVPTETHVGVFIAGPVSFFAST